MVARMLRSKFAKDVDFPLTRVGINAGGLLIGAIETTSQAVAQVVEFFIDRPNLKATAKAAARPGDAAAFDAMVWEALRFVPIRPDIFRNAVGAYTLPKGTAHESDNTAGTRVDLLNPSALSVAYDSEYTDRFTISSATCRENG